MKLQLENLTRQMYRSGMNYTEAVREFQRTFILTVLQDHGANQCKAASRLGIHRNTLRRALHELDIDIRMIRAAAGRKPAQNERLIMSTEGAK